MDKKSWISLISIIILILSNFIDGLISNASGTNITFNALALTATLLHAANQVLAQRDK